MSVLRSIKNRENAYIKLDRRIILDPRLSLEGKGFYGMLEANAIEIKDIPESIIEELIEVGYLEVSENE